MSTGLIVGIVVVVIIVVLIGWGVSAYNNLVTLKNRVKNGSGANRRAVEAARRPHPEPGEYR